MELHQAIAKRPDGSTGLSVADKRYALQCDCYAYAAHGAQLVDVRNQIIELSNPV